MHLVELFASAIVGVTAALAGWRRSFVWRARYLYLAAAVKSTVDQQYLGWVDQLRADEPEEGKA